MSTPFTSPADSSWQEMLDEITLAYSERRQALGQAAYIPTDDKDVQAAAYWSSLQSWLETYCLSFIDHVSGPLNPAGTAFLYFTLATFHSAAGLNASGFRRVPEEVEWDGINDPVWSYGLMQAGDIIGPWILEDLQAAFSALKWTLLNGTWTDKGENSVREALGTGSPFAGDWDQKKLQAETTWDAGGEGPIYSVVSPQVWSDGLWWFYGGRYNAALVRAYFYPTVVLPASFCPRAIDLYLIGVANGVLDFNGDDIPAVLTVIDSVAETMNAIDAVFSMIGEVPKNGTYPIWCDKPLVQDVHSTRGYIATLYNLIKWNFTNQN